MSNSTKNDLVEQFVRAFTVVTSSGQFFFSSLKNYLHFDSLCVSSGLDFVIHNNQCSRYETTFGELLKLEVGGLVQLLL